MFTDSTTAINLLQVTSLGAREKLMTRPSRNGISTVQLSPVAPAGQSPNKLWAAV